MLIGGAKAFELGLLSFHAAAQLIAFRKWIAVAPLRTAFSRSWCEGGPSMFSPGLCKSLAGEGSQWVVNHWLL
jgi:hypothetical protein